MIEPPQEEVKGVDRGTVFFRCIERESKRAKYTALEDLRPVFQE